MLISLNKVSAERIREKRLSGVLSLNPPHGAMHPNASLHHCLPAGMRKTWLIFLTTRVEFYRLSCVRLLHSSPLKQKKKKMAEGVICLTAHQTEASCFCCRGAASCLHWGFGESLCSQFPPSCFFFSCPPLHSPPVESKFFSHNHSFLERLILKKLFFHSPSLWAQSLTFCSRSRKVMLDLT